MKKSKHQSTKKSRNASVTPKSSSRYCGKSIKSLNSGPNRYRSQRDRTRNKSNQYKTSQSSNILAAGRRGKQSEIHLSRSGTRKSIPL
jgi:hypothetical protein